MPTSQDLLAHLRTLHRSRIDLTLDRLRRLLSQLGDPHQRLPPVVHVAGTNGKGSVVALLRAMLEADGRRVHVYTSPPLEDVRECIVLATGAGESAAIGEAHFVALLARVIAANAGQQITSFEAETAAALLAFAATPADVVLLETGLGGRLDATNVVERPWLTVITPIGLDHMDLLGPSLERIAQEKAGILKRGVAAVIGRQETAALDVIEAAAARLDAPLSVFGRDFDAYEQNGRLIYQTEGGLLDMPKPRLAGRHQLDNAGVAIAAALALGDLAPSEGAIEQGLVRVVCPARLQVLPQAGLAAELPLGSEIWLDGGHNAAAAGALAQAMAEADERAPKPLALVIGMLRSKQPTQYLRQFQELAALVVGVPIADPSRAYAAPFEPEELATFARGLGFDGATAPDVVAALSLCRARLAPGPIRVLVCGSFHLAGEVLRLDRQLAAAGTPKQ